MGMVLDGGVAPISMVGIAIPMGDDGRMDAPGVLSRATRDPSVIAARVTRMHVVGVASSSRMDFVVDLFDHLVLFRDDGNGDVGTAFDPLHRVVRIILVMRSLGREATHLGALHSGIARSGNGMAMRKAMLRPPRFRMVGPTT